MKYAALVVAVALIIGVAGCAQPEAQPEPWRVTGADMTEDGIAVFSAKGEAPVVETEDPVVLAKARLAAATIAKANLLEKVKGAVVTGNVTVGDLMFQNQAASTMVRGYLARASVVIEETPRGVAPDIVIATATLNLSPDDYADLAQYVE